MSLKAIAAQTLQILDAGYIITTGGERVSLFAVYDTSAQRATLKAFEQRFARE